MADRAEASQLIHGVLDATIFQAEHLYQGTVLETIQEAFHLGKLYATVDIGTATVAGTRLIEFHRKNLVWNESFRIYCAHSAPSIVISIKNPLPIFTKVLGRAKIPVSKILASQLLEGWFDLFNNEGRRLEKAKVHVLLKFSDVASDPFWNAGIKLDQFSGVPHTFFPERTGCEVTLYQDSHLSDNFLPAIHLSGDKMYQPPRLWEDLYNAITEAEHFIYVAGWSVNVTITLVRDPERMITGAAGVTVGELLKRKADEGVAVLVMVWKDWTSISLLGNAGQMETHGNDTFKFFKGSKVKCFLCPRDANRSLTAIQQVEIGALFTHHQKTVSLDSPIDDGAGNSARRVISFVGGIDLCDGRYDDENHTLFGDLDTTYLHDFQQKNFPHADLHHGGPREPWHDTHSKLEGLAAWDVLANFEQRWMKQAPKGITNYLVNLRDQPEIFPIPSSSSGGSESWNVQVFRSIDDTSVVGFPSDPSEASKLGLVSLKNVTIDQSIHSSYIEAIRRARRFIYIENQYFFGSCASWSEDQECGCLNLVPIEIALKIASKIRLRERFAAYIVMPMWPEGEPEGEAVKAILHWNKLTMEMMYGIVAKAIQEAGLSGKSHPCDYLNFFCLGNREVERSGEYVPPARPKPGSNYSRAQTNRRFLIYVHAKLMIVDDEYVIVGSANLNQRSLEGCRDTEIAQGSYQPMHLNGVDGPARGLVHGYRMSLWYEHFMSHCEHPSRVFLEPESLECVTTVRRIAENLWEKFIGEEVEDLPGHLLPFPIRVSKFGELSELPEDGCFPDTRASVMGKRSAVLPSTLTAR